MFKITRTAGRINLLLEAKKIGDDFLLILSGGKEHVGAIAVGIFDEKSQRASSSVLCLPGHREEQVALQGARLVSKATHRTVVFIVGIHLDSINLDEIEKINSMSGEMIKSFITFLDETGKRPQN